MAKEKAESERNEVKNSPKPDQRKNQQPVEDQPVQEIDSPSSQRGDKSYRMSSYLTLEDAPALGDEAQL